MALKELIEKKDEHPTLRRDLTYGQRAADNVAKYAGSWTFIVGFMIFLGVWMIINIYAWFGSWDPYPFILLNLVLSCLAAIQAPIILMSQNRQAERDRLSARYDYKINRKSEREIQDIQKDLDEIKIMLMHIKKTPHT